ncbi:MAG: ATP-binding protein [Rikenellaceae bacterium]
MIVEFIARNFRSIKNDIVLSFESNSSKQKIENIFSAKYGTKGNEHNLIKSLAIYGANASGKSNIINAFFALQYLIKSSHRNEIGNTIPCYEPFALSVENQNMPTYFEVSFIMPLLTKSGEQSTKFKYIVQYNKTKIEREELYIYNTVKDTLLFTRKSEAQQFHTVEFKRSLNVEGAKKEVLENQLFLSKFNTDVHSVLTPICAYFRDIDIELADGSSRTKIINDRIAREIMSDSTNSLKKKLIHLTEVADMSIKGISVKERDESEFNFLGIFPDKLKKKIIDDNKLNIEFEHPLYKGEQEVDTERISIERQSLGTQVIFGLGARMLQALEKGGVLFYDEINSSLHPLLSKFLVSLFNNNISNPKNAQLVVTSHEPSIIERGHLRSDQIWFVEKNVYGASELFSAQDFEGVREDIPFDKWYESGKFGAIPNIGSVTQMFDTFRKDEDYETKKKTKES